MLSSGEILRGLTICWHKKKSNGVRTGRATQINQYRGYHSATQSVGEKENNNTYACIHTHGSLSFGVFHDNLTHTHTHAAYRTCHTGDRLGDCEQNRDQYFQNA